MRTLFSKPIDLSKELNCSWGDKGDVHLLEKDLSIDENLKMAMERFPMLEKLVKKHNFSSQVIEAYKQECYIFVCSESEEFCQLKEFFRHWLPSL